MKALIVCTSDSHGNTARIAQVMGHALQAPVVTPDDVDPADLAAAQRFAENLRDPTT